MVAWECAPEGPTFFLKNRQNIRWGQYKSYSGADPGFSVGASTLRRGASIIFYQKKKPQKKPHEIDNILVCLGPRTRGPPPIRFAVAGGLVWPKPLILPMTCSTKILKTKESIKMLNCRTKGDYIMKQRKNSSRCVSRFCGLGGG